MFDKEVTEIQLLKKTKCLRSTEIQLLKKQNVWDLLKSIRYLKKHNAWL